MRQEDKTPIQLAYERRNRDLDPQLVRRGKDEQNWSDPGSVAGASLVVHAPPLFIQEKVHPKVLIDDLRRETKARADKRAPPASKLFADFNGLPDEEAKTEFYQRDANCSNRIISGERRSVIAALAQPGATPW